MAVCILQDRDGPVGVSQGRLHGFLVDPEASSDLVVGRTAALSAGQGIFHAGYVGDLAQSLWHISD